MGLLSEEIGALSVRTLSDVEEALLKRVPYGALSKAERSFPPRKPKEEARSCWRILSALSSFDGKEEREAYYALL